MVDYGRSLTFGLSVEPDATAIETITALTDAAAVGGLDLIAIQDHPYTATHLDTWTLIAYLASRNSSLRFFPSVANLALRTPALLAKAAATLDLLTGGRVELAVGGGASTDDIVAMGGPRRSGQALVESTREALEVIRLAWQTQRATFAGSHYHLHDYQPGPAPRRSIELWLGAFRPRMLALAGARSDGWVAPLNLYLPPDQVPAAQRRIDQAAVSAGRDPASIRRIYNVMCRIGPHGTGPGISGTPRAVANVLAEWSVDLGFETFVLWPADPTPYQVRSLAEEVVPHTRELVAQIRNQSPDR